ncbi:MAG: hypothetical protein ACRD6X_15765, partial [Pyrinomonadaceae bacterium]
GIEQVRGLFLMPLDRLCTKIGSMLLHQKPVVPAIPVTSRQFALASRLQMRHPRRMTRPQK